MSTKYQALADLRAEFHRRQHNIWQRYKSGEQLEGEDKLIGELLTLHTDWYPYWESTNFDHDFNPDTDKNNPYFHIVLDTYVMNLIHNEGFAEAKITYKRLIDNGDTQLEAIHKMGFESMFEILNFVFFKKFSLKRYIGRLKKLK